MLIDGIQTDLNHAIKNQLSDKVEALRYLLSLLKNERIAKRQDLSQEEATTVIRKEIKKLQDACLTFDKAGRHDLSKRYNSQIKIFSAYLPVEIPDDILRNELQTLINTNRELFEKNPKALIGIGIKKLGSKASPSRIANIVASLQEPN